MSRIGWKNPGLTPTQEARVVRAYDAGTNMLVIIRRFNVSRETVRAVIEAAGRTWPRVPSKYPESAP